MLQVRRLIGDQAVRRRVRLVEAVGGELRHELEDLVGDLGVDALLLGAGEELGLLLLHRLLLLLAHGAAQEIGLTERVAGQRARRSA